MNLLGFKDPIKYSDTNVGKRQAKLIKAANQALQERQSLINTGKAADEIFGEMLQESNANNLVSSKKQSRSAIARQNAAYKKNFRKNLVTSFLTEATLNSLIFDEYFMDDNRNKLKASIKEEFDYLYDNGFVTEDNFYNSKNTIMEDIILEFENIVNENTKGLNYNYLSESEIYNLVLTEAPKAKEATDDMASIVADKVTDTIEEENKIAKKNKKKDTEDEEKKKEQEDDLNEIEGKDAKDDEDVDANTNADPNAEGDETDTDTDTDVDADSDENDDTDDDVEDTENNADANGDASDTEGTDDTNEGTDEAESTDDASNEDSADDQTDSTDNTTIPSADSTSDDNKISFTFSGKAKNINLQISNESNIIDPTFKGSYFGSKRKIKALKENKTLFRGFLNNAMKEMALNEAYGSRIDMDVAMGKAIINYTMLECLNTARLIEFSSKDIRKIANALNM